MRAADAILYFGSPVSNRFHLLGSIITGTLWSAILLGGIWFRNNWCRYVLILFLMVSLIMPAIEVYGIWSTLHITNYTLLYSIIASMLIFGSVTWTLISSRDIKRLTTRLRD